MASLPGSSAPLLGTWREYGNWIFQFPQSGPQDPGDSGVIWRAVPPHCLLQTFRRVCLRERWEEGGWGLLQCAPHLSLGPSRLLED